MDDILLSDIATVITKGTTPTSLGFDFTERGVNFIKIESISESGDFIPEKFAHISDECNEKLKRSQLEENDILFSIAGAIGRTTIVNSSILPANTNQALAIIRVPIGTINYSFLRLALESATIQEQIEKNKQGVAQLNISLKDVGNIRIPNLSSNEQDQIVYVLEKVNHLISLRKKQLQKLDDLVKARFVEMFGDVETNCKDWRKGYLRDHASVIVGYPFPSEGYSSEGIDIVGGYNLMQGYIQWEESKHWPDEKGFESYLLHANDIVMAMDRPWVNGGFKIALIDASHLPAVLIQRTACIRGKDIEQEFLYYMLDTKRFAEHCNITGSLVPHISNKDINSYQIILPPREIQQQFAAFVSQVDKSKLSIQQGLEKLETLKKSLMQQYFG